MSRTVLLIEHDTRRVEAFQRLLTGAGLKVVVATESLQALEVFQQLRPDLVMIEAAPPEMAGFELCQALKETPQGRSTPVIIAATTPQGESYRAQALDRYGCDELLETPLSDRRLIESCLRLLDNGIPTRAGERPARPSLASLAPGESLMDDEALDQALGTFDSLIEDPPPVTTATPAQGPDRAVDFSALREGDHGSDADQLMETLEELERVADEFEDRLPIESVERAVRPPSPTAEPAIDALAQSLEELTRVDADLPAENSRSPEVQVAGDRGEDIGDHLDSLFAGTNEPEAPRQAPKAIRLAPSAAPPGMGAGQPARPKPVVAKPAQPARHKPVVANPAQPARHKPVGLGASPPAKTKPAAPVVPTLPLAIPRATEPVAQPRLSVTHASIRERPNRTGVALALAAVVLLAIGGYLWFLNTMGEKSEPPLIETLEQTTHSAAAREDTAPAGLAPEESIPEETISESMTGEQAVGPEPLPPEPKAKSLVVLPPPAASTRTRAGGESKVVRPQQEKTVAAPSAPELRAVSVPSEPAAAAASPTPAAPARSESSAVETEVREVAPAPPESEPNPVAAVPPFQPPVVLQRIEPTYPPRAIKRGDQGTVVLKVLVNEGGKVVRVVVEQGLAGSELEAAAIDAVLRWDYHPATENGHTIRAWTTEKFAFVPPSPTKN